MSVSGVVSHLKDIVKRVVFIAGLLPPEGRAPLRERPLIERCLVRAFNGREKGVWLPAPILRQRLGLESSEPAVREVLSRLTSDPAGPWTTPTSYGQFPGRMPIAYVLFLRDRFVTVEAQSRYAALLANAELTEIDAGHEGILTHPEEVAEVLLRYA